MESKSGTYALVLVAETEFTIRVGRFGLLSGKPGYYIYVGSAFGPGGVKARVKHHKKVSSRPHWHIDYMRQILPLTELWYTYDNQKREHEWAHLISKTSNALLPFPRFGASDCSCPAHLIYLSSKPSYQRFRERMYSQIADHAPIHREVLR